MAMMRAGRRLRDRAARRRSGQGMVEYGLVIGLVATWVIFFMLALRPIFSEQFAADNLEGFAGQGQAQLASEFGLELRGVSGGGGGGGIEDPEEEDDF
jgi:Flp pilus assembly pilin Flp